jgi:hypothetical protein
LRHFRCCISSHVETNRAEISICWVESELKNTRPADHGPTLLLNELHRFTVDVPD